MPNFGYLPWSPDDNSKAALPNGPFLECYKAQRLSAALRDAETQDYKQSASLPFLPQVPVLHTADSPFPCLIFGVPCSWAAAAGAGGAQQDEEEQQEGKSGSAFATRRGGM